MSRPLSWTQARRIALRAQGMGRPRREEIPYARASRAARVRTLEHTHLLQIDSVSVFARAHHLPVYTRFGSWDPAVLERASRPGPHRLVQEALAHEAAYTTPTVHALLDFRRRRAAQRDWGAVRRAAQQSPDLLERVLAAVADHGPISAAAVSALLGDSDRGEGWGWRRTTSQWSVEYLFRSGVLDCVGRSAQFERLYVAPQGARVPAPPGAPITDDDEEQQLLQLVRLASRALGVAEIGSIADYFRLGIGQVRPAVEHLLGTGELSEVAVANPAGPLPMLLHAHAPRPTAVRTAALVSPFDPIAFHRPRLRTLFDVDYRIGIYTPAARRTTGYYSLLFLLGDVIPARVDLRADRARGILEVRGTYREELSRLPARSLPAQEHLLHALGGELHRAARWQGLDDIEVLTGPGTGELSMALAGVIRGAPIGGST